jgi:L-alanine-DL-glutamate epimerase-like enolase superfamily enzyme
VEYLVRYQEVKQYFHDPIYRPENGSITLPTLPGLGMMLDESRVEARQVIKYA